MSGETCSLNRLTSIDRRNPVEIPVESLPFDCVSCLHRGFLIAKRANEVTFTPEEDLPTDVDERLQHTEQLVSVLDKTKRQCEVRLFHTPILDEQYLVLRETYQFDCRL